MQQIEEKVKIDLESAVLTNGKIKAETNVAQVQRGCHFCADQTQNQAVATTKSKLSELGAKALNIFQVDYAPLKRKFRSKKQNKHRAAKRKAVCTSQRTSAFCKRSPLA